MQSDTLFTQISSQVKSKVKSIYDYRNHKLSKIILAVLFFLFIYKIIYNVLIFFSIDENLVQMYMAWVGIFILLITILPYKRYAV